MRLCAGLLGVVAIWLSGWGCTAPPVLLSTDGCWTVEVAVTRGPDAITILTPRELSRLQLSKAIPPPDWWDVPEDAEGWTELMPNVLEDAAAPRCGQGRLGARSRPRLPAAACSSD